MGVVELKQDDRTGLWHRPDKWGDVNVLKQIRSEYNALDIQEGDRVLDAGAHIGAFAWLALQRGAKKVVCYEPAPDNFELLERNFGDHPFVVLSPAALVARAAGDRELFLGERDTSGYSLYVRRGRTSVTVPTVGFLGELRRYRPTVVKVDIEGGEYEIPLRFADHVRSLCIEFHLKRKEWRERTLVLIAEVEAQGFVAVRAPALGTRAWDALGIWKR